MGIWTSYTLSSHTHGSVTTAMSGTLRVHYGVCDSDRIVVAHPEQIESA